MEGTIKEFSRQHYVFTLISGRIGHRCLRAEDQVELKGRVPNKIQSRIAGRPGETAGGLLGFTGRRYSLSRSRIIINQGMSADAIGVQDFRRIVTTPFVKRNLNRVTFIRFMWCGQFDNLLDKAHVCLF